MSQKTYSATEVKNRLGRVLREVALSDGPIVIERDSKPVAVIMSIDEYKRSMTAAGKTAVANPLQLQSSFGMWRNRQDIDENWLANGRSRWESDWPDE